MQTKPKANSIVTHTALPDGRIQFTVLGCEPFTVDPAAIPAHKARRAMIHGLVQRISDGAALSRDKDTGKPASPADKRARMFAIAQHLLDPATPWEMKGSGGGAPKPDETLLAAVAEVQGVDVETMRTRVKAQAEKRGVTPRAFLAKVREGSQAVRDVEARMLAAGVDEDGDDMLMSLGD
jgi:hypothetical protein